MVSQEKPTANSLRYLSNLPSLAGLALALVALLAMAALFVVGRITRDGFGYLGLAYGFAGSALAVGATLAGAGALRIWLRRRRGIMDAPISLLIDLNRPRTRWIAFSGFAFTLAAALVVSVGSYQTVHYVESDTFCSNTCHTVMHPEGLAHNNSPHANVECVTCHVGSGAGSFVEAKLNGIRQLLAVSTGNYQRPIPTPIHRMRPARETCEQCHWRKRWIGYKEKLFTYYGSEENNPVTHMRMLLKVGGAKAGLLAGEGIHYHMTLGRQVEFIARDRRKQDIAWVRVKETDGSIKEFSRGKPLTAAEKASLPVHRMDCMDCHNRPAHQLKAPMVLMNEALASGRIDATIPFIKLKGVEVLSAEYATTPEAMSKIASTLLSFYKEEHEDFLEENRGKIEQAIKVIQDLFRANMFPEMKASWASYPDNLGHRDSPGCFRCHNDEMKTSDGQTVFTTCTKCHVVLTQGDENGDENATAIDFDKGQAFFHSGDDDTLEEYTECVSCHDGGTGVY